MDSRTRYVGQAMKRREDPRFLRGAGRYLDDLQLPGMLHMAFARSSHAHALLSAVDTGLAERLSGVTACVTGAMLQGKIRPIRAILDVQGQDATYAPTDWFPLAAGKVRFVGEPVAAVLAADRYVAEDGCDGIRIEYDPLPPVVDVEQAAQGSPSALHDAVADNVLYRLPHRSGDVDEVFAQAPVKVAGRLRTPRCTGGSIENRGVLADYDASKEMLTVWSSTQTPHILRTALADFLDFPEHRLRILVPDVGGAFGLKMQVYPEELLCAYMSVQLCRPVKWTEDRRENLLASMHARDALLDVELAADEEGRLLGIRGSILIDVGAYSTYPLTAALEPLGTAQMLCGPYKLSACAYETLGVATNKCPVGAYRGVGQVAGTFARERLVDMLAARLGKDPAEVRRRNFIDPESHPYQAATGLVYDSGRYDDVLSGVLHQADYAGLRARQAEYRKAHRYVGVGMASYVEFTGMGSKTFRRRGMMNVPGHDAATVRVDPTGSIRVYVSATTQGQGHDTSLCQLVADELSVSFEVVHLVEGDTDLCPFGSGTFASRSLVASGGAAARAARQVKQQAVTIAARILAVSTEVVELVNGHFRVHDAPSRSLSLAEVARHAYAPGPTASGEMIPPGLDATVYYDPPPAAFANGMHLAMVEVDVETGVVAVLKYIVGEDCGTVVNPMIVEGQVLGAVAQGLGNALYEHMIYDEDGQLLTASFMDYLLPTAAEVPAVELVHFVTPSPLTENGVKGMAEGGTICAPAAIANAVTDALAPLGINVLELPLGPNGVRELIRQAGTVG